MDTTMKNNCKKKMDTIMIKNTTNTLETAMNNIMERQWAQQ